MKNLFVLIVIVLLSVNYNETSAASMGFAGQMEKNTTEVVSKKRTSNLDFISAELYKGTLNGTIKISLYLHEQEHPCGGDNTILNAMYKYDNQDKWILLSVSTDQQKKQFCMIEDGLTGVLFLEFNEEDLFGNWVSPSANKQYEVELKNMALDGPASDELDEILFDDLIYNKNDC